jgi:hypothetical protein
MGGPVQHLPVQPDPIPFNQVKQSYENASTGTPKKVIGGIAITLGGLAIAGAVAAIVVPFFVQGVPNALNMGQHLGVSGNMGHISATIGTIATAGTIVVGALVLTGGAFLVHKGRKEAAEKERKKAEFDARVNEEMEHSARRAQLNREMQVAAAAAGARFVRGRDEILQLNLPPAAPAPVVVS